MTARVRRTGGANSKRICTGAIAELIWRSRNEEIKAYESA
jgi:hypothetical protein